MGSRTRWLRRAATAVAAVCAAALGVADAGAAPSKPDYGLQAGRYGETTLDHNHFSYTVGPGAQVQDSVVVFNFRDEPIELDLYPADQIPARGGGAAPAQRHDPRVAVGSWVALTDRRVSVPPQGQLEVPFDLSVPDGVEPGQYLGAVVAETPIQAVDNGFSVGTRVALTIDVKIAGDLRPAFDLGPLKVARGQDTTTFTVEVGNTGNALITHRGAVEVTRGSKLVARLPLQPDDIYVIPTGEAVLRAQWDQPLLGRYRATGVVEGRLDGRAFDTKRTSSVALRYLARSILATSAVFTIGLVVGVANRRRWVAWRRRRREERREERAAVAAVRAQRRHE